MARHCWRMNASAQHPVCCVNTAAVLDNAFVSSAGGFHRRVFLCVTEILEVVIWPCFQGKKGVNVQNCRVVGERWRDVFFRIRSEGYVLWAFEGGWSQNSQIVSPYATQTPVMSASVHKTGGTKYGCFFRLRAALLLCEEISLCLMGTSGCPWYHSTTRGAAIIFSCLMHHFFLGWNPAMPVVFFSILRFCISFGRVGMLYSSSSIL